MITSHILNLFLYSLLASAGFAFLVKETPEERLRYGIKLFLLMTFGSVIIAWFMYPLPPA